jgi:hypothetical protein
MNYGWERVGADMTNKELTLIGMALKALVESGEIEKAKAIIDYMASDASLNQDEEKK